MKVFIGRFVRVRPIAVPNPEGKKLLTRAIPSDLGLQRIPYGNLGNDASPKPLQKPLH